MKLHTYTTIATCTAISTLSSNYTPSAQGLLPVMFFERIIIIIMIIIIIIIALSFSPLSWWEKRGVKEITPQLPQFTTGGGGNGNGLWEIIKKKINKIFGRR